MLLIKPLRVISAATAGVCATRIGVPKKAGHPEHPPILFHAAHEIICQQKRPRLLRQPATRLHTFHTSLLDGVATGTRAGPCFHTKHTYHTKENQYIYLILSHTKAIKCGREMCGGCGGLARHGFPPPQMKPRHTSNMWRGSGQVNRSANWATR